MKKIRLFFNIIEYIVEKCVVHYQGKIYELIE